MSPKSRSRACVLADSPGSSPPLSLQELRNAIPEHCFERSLSKSLSYWLWDLIEVFLTLFVTYKLHLYLTSPLARSFLWLVYWFYQGTTMTGLWVLAHECGHSAFSDYSTVNDMVGFTTHTLLTVPYFSWKHTHAKHHAHTNHLEEDDVWVPAKKQDLSKSTAFSNIVAVRDLALMGTIGWYAYLAFNSSGPAKNNHASHYNPNSILFRKKDYWEIAVSVVGLVLWKTTLVLIANHVGWMNLIFYYVIPLMVTNFYLTSITFLQHTDERVPHYEPEAWNWLRGALCSIDRTLGWFLDIKTHHIVDTHVCHHIFSTIPFYHAQEATVVLRNKLGPYYVSDKTPFLIALFNNMKRCREVEPDLKDANKSIMWFNVETNRAKSQ